MVYIKKVEMKGFKSYGNTTVTVPLSKGFTCIIGPNGSGKSNIADALLFVLGGLSAKSMRAEVFSDLIYTGKNTEFAKISLYFSNSNNEFPIDKNEVIITRVVYKDGRSVYKINKKKETRSYVLDLLSTVGVTPNGYNVIHQGEIMSFINMTSLERREIIEEISGIAEFEEKKRKGLRELEKTEENLARVSLIIEEVKKQMNRLEIEKNDALRYNFLKNEIQKLKGVLLYSKLENYTSDLSAAEREITASTEEITTLRSTQNAYSERIEQLENELEELERTLDTKNAEYLQINNEHEDLKRRVSKTDQSIRHEEESLQMNEREKTDLEEERDAIREKIRQCREDLEERQNEKVSLEKEIEKKKEKTDALERKIEEETDILKKDYDDLVTELEEKKELFYTKQNEFNSLENNLSVLKEKLKENKKSHEEKKERYARNTSDLEKYQSSLENLKKTIEDHEAEIEKIEGALLETDGELWKKKEDVLRIQSYFKAKKSFDLERDNPFKVIRRSGISGIYGKVKDLGKVRQEYSIALEVAGGRRLRYIVVDTEETARNCVKHLKKSKAGRATFIPLDTIRPRRRREAEEREGFVDYAINLVEFDEELRPIFEYVFGDTLIITDIDHAENFRSFRRVTLDGDLVERTGVVTGGFYKPRGGFVDKEREEKLISAEKRIKELYSKKENFEKKLIDFKKKLKEFEDRKIQIETRVEALEKILGDGVKAEITDLEETIASDEKIRADYETRSAAIEETVSSLQSEIETMEMEKKSVYAALMEKSGKDMERLDALKEELSATNTEYQRIDKEYISKKSTLDVLEPTYAGVLEKIEEKIFQAKNIVLKIEEYKKELEKSQKILSEAQERIDEKIEEIDTVKKKKADIKETIIGTRKEKEDHEKQIVILQTTVSSLKQKKQDLEGKIDELSDEAEFYEKTETVDDVKELEFKIRRMDGEREGLEPINMRAIEEYESTEERYLILKTKYEKILKEKEAVLAFIGKIEKRKKEVFMDTFSKVAENFSDIFYELSSGEGKLFLENNDDPFEGGVDVEAKPGGKEIKRTASMSGGEKALTALAFVFAIQRYKTAPFYLFDEIDAHLDDENVRKVAEMVKKASKNSQFIVITLRDAMMASADRLFGVSMRNKISHILAVELQDTAVYEGKKFEVLEEA
jgi:chromosome segregation protein